MLRPLFAQAGRKLFEPPPLEAPANRLLGLSARDILLIAGAGLLLAIILFLWVYLTRRERRHRSSYGGRVIYSSRSSRHHSGRRRRRRRHEQGELPRNPTLQETGGLPPIRSEEPQDPLRSL